MKTFILSIAFLFLSNVGYSQTRWTKSLELDFVFPQVKDYFYNNSKNYIFDVELVNEGFLLSSYAVQSSYNYFLVKNLSIGVLGGFQTQSDPNYTMLKLGGIIHYHFVDKNNVYAYISSANNFTLNKRKFRNGNNSRIGIGFPIIKKDNFIIICNLFLEQNYFKLDSSEKLLNLSDEIPRSLTFKSRGISFGIRF